MVNLLLAYAFGVVASLISRSWFLPGIVAGYWLTNVIGFVLLHEDAVDAVSAGAHPYAVQRFTKDFTISAGYTILMVSLVWFGFLNVPDDLLMALGR